jgi:hypothetical protein
MEIYIKSNIISKEINNYEDKRNKYNARRWKRNKIHWMNTNFIKHETIQIIMHYYKMWVQFTSPCSLNQWIHYFFIGPRSLQPTSEFIQNLVKSFGV